ncbi:MAG: prepilin-type N-terminal cleavage/methylation domain-containing protein [Armatimonadota bacterium]|nr:prepilin-type N-terminal cleavage/methylation domain-containing protein [bacterium]
MTQQHRRSGFSLIELLVVIAIIAILAAVLAPVYTTVKRSARRTVCQSNLSQISRGFNLYLNDYSGCYPNTNNQYLWSGYYWREPFRKYAAVGRVSSNNASKDTILSCPSDPTPPGEYSGTSYAYSATFYMTPDQVNAIASGNYLRTKYASTNPKLPCTTIGTSAVRFPSKKVMVAEYWTLHCDDDRVGWYDDLAETGKDPWSGARNCLFADGHVKYIQTKNIQPAASPIVNRQHPLPDINLTCNGVAGKDIN